MKNLVIAGAFAMLLVVAISCTRAEEERMERTLYDVVVDSPSQPNNVFDNIGIGEGYEDNSVNPSPLITPKDPA